MRRVTASDLKNQIGAVLDSIEAEPAVITRKGEAVAVIVSPDMAGWAVAVAAMHRGRVPPFSQDALSEWIAGVAEGGGDSLAEVMAAHDSID